MFPSFLHAFLYLQFVIGARALSLSWPTSITADTIATISWDGEPSFTLLVIQQLDDGTTNTLIQDLNMTSTSFLWTATVDGPNPVVFFVIIDSTEQVVQSDNISVMPAVTSSDTTDSMTATQTNTGVVMSSATATTIVKTASTTTTYQASSTSASQLPSTTSKPVQSTSSVISTAAPSTSTTTSLINSTSLVATSTESLTASVTSSSLFPTVTGLDDGAGEQLGKDRSIPYIIGIFAGLIVIGLGLLLWRQRESIMLRFRKTRGGRGGSDTENLGGLSYYPASNLKDQTPYVMPAEVKTPIAEGSNQGVWPLVPAPRDSAALPPSPPAYGAETDLADDRATLYTRANARASSIMLPSPGHSPSASDNLLPPPGLQALNSQSSPTFPLSPLPRRLEDINTSSPPPSAYRSRSHSTAPPFVPASPVFFDDDTLSVFGPSSMGVPSSLRSTSEHFLLHDPYHQTATNPTIPTIPRPLPATPHDVRSSQYPSSPTMTISTQANRDSAADMRRAMGERQSLGYMMADTPHTPHTPRSASPVLAWDDRRRETQTSYLSDAEMQRLRDLRNQADFV